jgi:hypothetical protein
VGVGILVRMPVWVNLKYYLSKYVLQRGGDVHLMPVIAHAQILVNI